MNILQQILHDLRRGKMVILTDDKARENEGDLLCAAEKITPAKIAFMAKVGSGLICAPMTKERVETLDLPEMIAKNTSPLGCNFTVSVDAKKGVKTGISAYDRAATIHALVNPRTRPQDLTKPGHVFPLIAHESGVLVRAGHTEGAIELMKLAGFSPVAVICEIMGQDGSMLSGLRLMSFAKKYKLSMVSIQTIADYLRDNSKISRAVETRLPTAYGEFQAIVYKASDSKEHVALVKGNIAANKSILARIHSECFTGDVFESLRCDCNYQLDCALKRLGREETGILLYLRHEGRGIGLVNKLKAYNLQDKGYDTVSANEKLGFQADSRDYTVAYHILKDLGVSSVRLMTNNPQKIAALEKFGLEVSRVPLEAAPHDNHQRRYLMAKKLKLGHLLRKV